MFVSVLFMFVFFFFKQKTAYEMRISDWSSDVCSSDLHTGAIVKEIIPAFASRQEPASAPAIVERIVRPDLIDQILEIDRPFAFADRAGHIGPHASAEHVAERRLVIPVEIGRASCREECVRTCRSRWSPYH